MLKLSTGLTALVFAAALFSSAPAVAQSGQAGKEGRAEGKEHVKDSVKYHLKASKGGEVVFKGKKVQEKYKFRGYSKKKAAAAYEAEAEKNNRLNKKLHEALKAEDKAKAKELAAEYEMTQDVAKAVDEKVGQAAEADEKQKAEAAKELVPEMKDDIARRIKKFNEKHGGAAKEKVIEIPEAAQGGDSTAPAHPHH